MNGSSIARSLPSPDARLAHSFLARRENVADDARSQGFAGMFKGGIRRNLKGDLTTSANAVVAVVALCIRTAPSLLA